MKYPITYLAGIDEPYDTGPGWYVQLEGQPKPTPIGPFRNWRDAVKKVEEIAAEKISFLDSDGFFIDL